MKTFVFPLLIAIITPLTTAQQLISTTLPACVQACVPLQQGQTGCTPAGGAPVSNQDTYKSCFCQSALLTQLYSNSAAQLCTNCAPNDMSTIQNWYKSYCGKGGAAVPTNGQNGNAQQPTPTTSSSSTVSPTATSAAQGTNQQGLPQAANNANNGPWMANHWKWIVMLVVIFIGLSVVAIVGWFLHRRYHRRREAQWNLGAASQPNINTWGPGQSVHNLGFTGAAAENEKEKGKSPLREEVRVEEPARTLRANQGRRSSRFSGRFF